MRNYAPTVKGIKSIDIVMNDKLINNSFLIDNIDGNN